MSPPDVLPFQNSDADSVMPSSTDAGGFTAVVISASCGLVCAFFLRLSLKRRNASRDKAAGEIDYDNGTEDMTDLQNKAFRYTL